VAAESRCRRGPRLRPRRWSEGAVPFLNHSRSSRRCEQRSRHLARRLRIVCLPRRACKAAAVVLHAVADGAKACPTCSSVGTASSTGARSVMGDSRCRPTVVAHLHEAADVPGCQLESGDVHLSLRSGRIRADGERDATTERYDEGDDQCTVLAVTTVSGAMSVAPHSSSPGAPGVPKGPCRKSSPGCRWRPGPDRWRRTRRLSPDRWSHRSLGPACRSPRKRARPTM